MNNSLLIRTGSFLALVLLVACDQHSAILNKAALIDAENAAVRQQIQVVENQLVTLGVGRPEVAQLQQRQIQASKEQVAKLQNEITQLSTAVERLGNAVSVLETGVKTYINQLKN
jgi:cob(I)alamin adenosyltransferase